MTRITARLDFIAAITLEDEVNQVDSQFRAFTRFPRSFRPGVSHHTYILPTIQDILNVLHTAFKINAESDIDDLTEVAFHRSGRRRSTVELGDSAASKTTYDYSLPHTRRYPTLRPLMPRSTLLGRTAAPQITVFHTAGDSFTQDLPRQMKFPPVLLILTPIPSVLRLPSWLTPQIINHTPSGHLYPESRQVRICTAADVRLCILASIINSELGHPFTSNRFSLGLATGATVNFDSTSPQFKVRESHAARVNAQCLQSPNIRLEGRPRMRTPAGHKADSLFGARLL
ncbi:hypothetical protein C8R44DRAFT_869462 [Mycena epipterygia]|nr:hypothetical protein C8R44DRAFT_869462 [Mycena epipterygia]